ncbi:MAG: hypothetical protein N3E40_00155 [Dehalococcoidia bacterium]|nr:hypothetical protein [Dehalococcoidia bacterium]
MAGAVSNVRGWNDGRGPVGYEVVKAGRRGKQNYGRPRRNVDRLG